MLERAHDRSRLQRLLIVAAITLAAFLLALALPPIPQPQEYHRFADQRIWEGIPNYFNVASNLPLALVGVLGLCLLSCRRRQAEMPMRLPWQGFFLGAVLTGAGSAWYHWAPDNARLVWDRLPMTLCFMSFLTAMIGERIGARAGRLAYLPLLLLGIFSVLYWQYSEERGAGDLRLYILAQFLALLLAPVLVTLFRGSDARDDRDILVALALYVVALLCDTLLDAHLFAIGELVGGHALKHLLAAAAALQLFAMLRRRMAA